MNTVSERLKPLRAAYGPWARWLLWGTLALILALLIAFAILMSHWPFTQEKVTHAIDGIITGDTRITGFHRTYFPPGCVVDGLSVYTRPPATQPLIFVKKLTMKASYTALFARQHRLSDLIFDGLRFHIPPGGANVTIGRPGARFEIDTIRADNSVVEVEEIKPAGAILQYDLQALRVLHLSSDGAAGFNSKMHIPFPDGELAVNGDFGPFNALAAGKTPVSGSFALDHADLQAFKNIGGIVSSRGKFSGVLQQVRVTGSAESPDFDITHASHKMAVTSEYDVVVDGTSGDANLERIHSHVGHTTVVSNGRVYEKKGTSGKFVELDFSSSQGRIQDLLRLIVHATPAPMTGTISLHGHALVPPGDRRFLERLQLTGDFGIGGAQFTGGQAQAAIDKMSERAEGEPKDNPERVISDLKGHANVRDGVAHLSGIQFQVPGAAANLAGTFNLISEQIDLHGKLAMRAQLSDTTTGVKSFLLKFVDPFFKKKKQHAGSVVYMNITGSYSHPNYGVSLMGR